MLVPPSSCDFPASSCDNPASSLSSLWYIEMLPMLNVVCGMNRPALPPWLPMIPNSHSLKPLTLSAAVTVQTIAVVRYTTSNASRELLLTHTHTHTLKKSIVKCHNCVDFRIYYDSGRLCFKINHHFKIVRFFSFRAHTQNETEAPGDEIEAAGDSACPSNCIIWS